ncbi:unnamed protein product [Rodentolepis nana]|uniref:Uncharacterized protein n=1 Tax=Rodentolepis nana TaxID=102285 RepID=A0A0R3TN88_RODNA|nr:unnamed protein product [Rodentolepis nana]
MAEGNEDDVYMLEVAVPPFENEFEEEQLEVDCVDAFSKLPTTEVNSFRWTSLKKKVLEYKDYLEAKADHLNTVKHDDESSQEYYKRCLLVLKRLNTIEREAIEKRQSTRPSKRRRC